MKTAPKYRLQQWALMYLVAWSVSPPLAYGGIYRVAAILAMMLLMVSNMHRMGRKEKNALLGAAFVVGWMLMIGVFVGDSFSYRINTCISIAFLICYLLVNQNQSLMKNSAWIVTASMVLITIWNMTTLRGLAAYPGIARILAKNSAASEYYSKRGVGGYGYIYCVALFLPIALSCLLNKKKRITIRMIAAVCLATSFAVVFKSQYFLAMLIATGMVLAYWIFGIRNKGYRLIILVLLLFAMLFAYLNADQLLLLARNAVSFRSIQAKIDSIRAMLVSDMAIGESEFAARYERYTRDLKLILSSPFFGSLRYAAVGKHSHILDIFAQYGVLIGTAYMWLAWKPFRTVRDYNKRVSESVLFAWLIINILNSSTYAFSAIVCILLPLCCHIETGVKEK